MHFPLDLQTEMDSVTLERLDDSLDILQKELDKLPDKYECLNGWDSAWRHQFLHVGYEGAGDNKYGFKQCFMQLKEAIKHCNQMLDDGILLDHIHYEQKTLIILDRVLDLLPYNAKTL
jgi:hypothetical protein